MVLRFLFCVVLAVAFVCGPAAIIQTLLYVVYG
jgi:hypothetical protein